MRKLRELERQYREQRERRVRHLARWERLRTLETAAGLRVVDAPGLLPRRVAHEPGARVLYFYPPREGTVITYEESDKTNGGDLGGHCFVRFDNGFEVLGRFEDFVSLELEADAASAGDRSLPGLLGVDRGTLPHPTTEGRPGRLG